MIYYIRDIWRCSISGNVMNNRGDVLHSSAVEGVYLDSAQACPEV